MKTIIAGSRCFTNISLVKEAVDLSGFNITAVISGGARGVDTLAIQFAKENNIPLEVYPANWNKYGRSAGYMRNSLMATKADALIAIWDGESKGTSHMIQIAKDLKVPTFIYKR